MSRELENRIRHLVLEKGPVLGYIPSQYDPTKFYFHRAKQHLDRFGFQEYRYFDIDGDYKPGQLETLSQCDAIYLSGGNTYYFLKNLRKRELLSFLKDFVEKGGLLIGVSAGAMVMSPTIAVARFLDANEVGLSDLNALELAPLHFLPHFSERVSDVIAVKSFADQSFIPLYVCDDQAGIIIENDKMSCYGNVKRAGQI
ncbi:Type 1 glutamine amidotransferase-like domain-containing protein [Pseudalkalibacillus salsuginis]|uniref:Type 1 glutamine amidotransferase-like domain-containing protein n=1 Tax=Pseudalkalibacillus salsuginis TaxID=2910972 RepID=UPI001F28A3BA|nr:Type 1 glutamine amidotransferase-like domain-containing protein [Pseudalkalibacillus salsuginis]MCF6411765.1 Type 1 glutamine amidotransferase-like domain-containing protein [Pseudalkalibacillus salsuginis]